MGVQRERSPLCRSGHACRLRVTVREWVRSAGSLVWAIGTHFYLWTLPLILLQPIDVLDKLGIRLVIPDGAVYGLVAAGVFISAVDAFHKTRGQVRDLAEQSNARSVIGNLYVEPTFGVDPGPNTSAVQLMLRFNNRSNRPLIYRVATWSEVLGSDASELLSDPRPLTVAPLTYMDFRGRRYPEVVNGQTLAMKITCVYRFGLPLSASVVKMTQRFEALLDVHADGTTWMRPWTVTDEPPVFETLG